MPSELYHFFAADHDRLEKIFLRATADIENPDLELYEQFRAGLLKHISMEEKILIPAAQSANKGEPIALAQRIRLDHGAIAALLVPIPSPTVLNALKSILTKHNVLEEQSGGLYEVCESLTSNEMADLLSRLRSAPDVPTNPLMKPERVLDATKRALERAGYNLDGYEYSQVDKSKESE